MMIIHPSAKAMVANLVAAFRENDGASGAAAASTGSYELEGRLGEVGEDGRFVSSVPKEFMREVVNAVEAFDQWSSVTDWVEAHDVYYRDAQGREIRTSRRGADVEHCHKEVLGTVTLRTDAAPNAMRVQLARETAVPASALPQVVAPEEVRYVRCKLRKSFFYGSWRYDLTQCWHGASVAEVEQKRHRDEAPRFEIEIECTDPRNYVSMKGHTDEYVAHSLLLKLFNMYEKPPSHISA